MNTICPAIKKMFTKATMFMRKNKNDDDSSEVSFLSNYRNHPSVYCKMKESSDERVGSNESLLDNKSNRSSSLNNYNNRHSIYCKTKEPSDVRVGSNESLLDNKSNSRSSDVAAKQPPTIQGDTLEPQKVDKCEKATQTSYTTIKRIMDKYQQTEQASASVCEYPPINCPATVVISNRESYWGTLRLSEIEFAVNTLIDLLLGIYVNFQNHGRNRCSLAEYVRIVDKTICLVRMLFCLVDNVNRSSADEPIDQLIEDYDKCRKMYYKIKNSMAACGC